MKKFWIAFAVVAIVVGGGFGLLWYSFSRLEDTVRVDGGVLVWEVAGAFPEERDDTLWGQMRDRGELTLREAILALGRAAADDRITGLMMDRSDHF